MSDVKSAKTENLLSTDAGTLFADGERVLCFHGPLIYEAKVLKTKPETSPIEYYIHYAGWSKNWDEWVPEGRVLKFNEGNVKKQKELSRLYGERERSKKDNKKGNAKAKKTEQVGNDSRAPTPSKEGNISLNAGISTTAGTGATVKHESGISSSTISNSVTTSRSNRKSTQAANTTTSTPRPSTPHASIKEDSGPPEMPEDEAGTGTAPPQKKKRMSEQRSSVAGNGTDTVAPTPQQTPSTTGTTTSGSISDAPCVESEETYTMKLEVKIKIPDELKHCLTDDWYAISKEKKLLELPAKVTVQQIVDQYLAHKKSKSAKTTNASKEVAINDVLDGVIEYFNVMLGSQLLYKFERTQYMDIMQKHPETPLSELYGAFHLLRLFVRLGSMLTYSSLDQQAMQALLAHLHDFLKFLGKNSALYFSMGNFINVDPEYVRNAQ
ncbi:nuA4 complex subunit EAF3 homolog isoform X2 [Scaptodrosophila lebanonensis]|uniref:NuA4 complex subunit EAF3 homolog isoform X2 n=1 Tax=Drosophila lebanonensis TaxID=7225 RepID=A0A6J2TMB2_DROLE|nr:nuA4 complex subunit EAF3 homolog isoform X2 [Scaptodrosophila lebanonensis]